MVRGDGHADSWTLVLVMRIFASAGSRAMAHRQSRPPCSGRSPAALPECPIHTTPPRSRRRTPERHAPCPRAPAAPCSHGPRKRVALPWSSCGTRYTSTRPSRRRCARHTDRRTRSQVWLLGSLISYSPIAPSSIVVTRLPGQHRTPHRQRSLQRRRIPYGYRRQDRTTPTRATDRGQPTAHSAASGRRTASAIPNPTLGRRRSSVTDDPTDADDCSEHRRGGCVMPPLCAPNQAGT
jgi:hypothetical protein